MNTLAHEINKALDSQGVYLVADEQLRRLWPDPDHRYLQVKEFAASNGWRLFAYGEGRGAMFVKKRRSRGEIDPELDLEWWCGSGER